MPYKRLLLVVFPLFLLWCLANGAAAQSSGLELALHGSTSVAYGDALSMSGVAYEVVGYADLTPLAGGEVIARLRDYDRRGRRWRTIEEVTVESDRRGRLRFELPVPERRYVRPQLQVVVRKGRARREFEFPLQLHSPLAVDVLLDRQRYEPGETVHLWARVVRRSNGAPVPGRSLDLRVTDPAGRPLLQRSIVVGESGATSVDVALPESATDGSYHAYVHVGDSVATAATQASFEVARRTVERLLVEVSLEPQVVPPSGQLTGRVRVTTPSGTPVRGAEVQLQIEDDRSERQILRTDDEGIAPVRMQAPAYLAGDVQAQTLRVRVSHPAHGVLHTAASFLLSRVQWRVDATAENGAIVPEVDTEAWIAVTDPQGAPAPAGTRVRVTGAAVVDGAAEGSVDAHGLVAVPLFVRDGEAGPRRDGGCAGHAGVPLDVEVLGERSASARVCVRVATGARVRPRVRHRVLTPGGVLEVSLARHPEVRGRPVLVEILAQGRAVAAAFAEGDRARVTLPASVAGVLQVRARPVLPHDGRHPLDDFGGSSLAAGALDAVLVRPADAFALTVRTDRPRYHVRDTAELALQTSAASPRAWGAFVVRDLAAHGGEEPWRLSWMRSALDEAVLRPGAEGAELLLRASLAARLGPDAAPHREPPLVQPYWRELRVPPAQRGTLRDPVAARDHLRRRRIGQLMVAIERIVDRLDLDAARRAGVLVRRGGGFDFDPQLIANLVRQELLTRSAAETLGGELATLAMLQAVDPSFSFRTVTQRIARARLVRLMVATVAFTNPDDPNAARASQGQPPRRWLSRMVQLGMLRPADLLDPWGRPYELRPTTRPVVVLSDRAPTWELASAGPDGRFGSRDDIRDPFERVVPSGTAYAVASGEDALMSALSALAPGPRTLTGMARAYASVSLQAQEEQRQGVVTSSVSEESLDFAGGGAGLASGGGFNIGASPRRARSAAPALAEPPLADEAAEGELPSGRNQRRVGAVPGTFARLSSIVRERFPATLHFVGELPLDGTSTRAPLPLADALTTYRVEAIAWTATGWLTSARTELQVDQDATIDAPVPPFATVGDRLRIPVRVENRTAQPIEATIVVEAEGIGLELPDPRTVSVPAQGAVEEVVELSLGAVGEGAVVLRLLRAADERAYDAVRRPLTVWPDARLVRAQRSLLLTPGDDGAALTLEVPPDATARGAGELRVVPATALFGEPVDTTDLSLGWSFALLGEELPEPILQLARQLLRAGDPEADHALPGTPPSLAAAVSTVWRDATVQDVVLRRGLSAVSRVLGDPEDDLDPSRTLQLAKTLMALAPAVRAGGRPRVQGPLSELVQELRRRVGSGAVAADVPRVWAPSAAALGLTGGGARARELLRRVGRHVVRLDTEAFLEPAAEAGVTVARLEPTAWMAVAWASLGESGEALPFLRHLIALRRVVSAWPLPARALATAAAGLVAGAGAQGELRAWVDGRPVQLVSPDGEPQSAVRVAAVEGLGRPGTHRVRVEGAPMALVFVDVRYGRPWSAPPPRNAGLELSIDGPVGPRDARAGLALELRNRAPRLLTQPIVEVDLPAGAELDEPTREVLRAVGLSEPTVEGRTLRLRLRPLAPGGYARIPLPLRWSVGGELHGLGVSAYDEATPLEVGVRPVSVLPSRALTVEARGEEPEQAEAESSPPPMPPPPPPLPRPMEPLGPIAARWTLEVRS